MRYDFEDPEFNDANEELYDIDFFDDLEGDDDALGGGHLINITQAATRKIRELMATQAAKGLRLGVQGGGCSGFSYAMQFDNEKGPMDKEYLIDGLLVLVDGTSAMYLDGVTVDYVETLESSGFKFTNPLVKSTCGCGSSFSV